MSSENPLLSSDLLSPWNRCYVWINSWENAKWKDDIDAGNSRIPWTGIIKKLASCRKDYESYICITKGWQLLSLLEKPFSSLGESHLPRTDVVDFLDLYPLSSHLPITEQSSSKGEKWKTQTNTFSTTKWIQMKSSTTGRKNT